MNDGSVPIIAQMPSAEDVCSPPTAALAPPSRAEAERVARVFKAVADPTRIQLLAMIEASPSGEACVCDLTEPLGLSQPTISHHLKILVDAGLLTRSKRGTWAWYALDHDRLSALGAFLAPAR
ncbi:metalloregulator ArsR/SmtB family transcription factor [Actinocorallia sp. B10E7]|uniref:ArsR/SmtB family transcription factor n=1 Tax=Actinocorallia sp. B10E7 TaxID=3153558 RepID=UPI00325C6A8F